MIERPRNSAMRLHSYIKRQRIHGSWLRASLRWVSDRLKCRPEMIFCDKCECFHLTTAPHVTEWLDFQEMDLFGHMYLIERGVKFNYYKEQQ